MTTPWRGPYDVEAHARAKAGQGRRSRAARWALVRLEDGAVLAYHETRAAVLRLLAGRSGCEVRRVER